MRDFRKMTKEKFKSRSLALLTLLAVLLPAVGLAQKPQRTLVGKVVDSETSEPVPFANVFVRSSMNGTVTDFDGIFRLRIAAGTDSVTFKDLGYRERTLPLGAFGADTLVVALVPLNVALDEIKVRPDDAPRRLIRNVIAHKRGNDPERHNKVQFEKYSKWEYSLNNISDRAMNSWLLRGASNLMRADSDSNRFLTVYFS